jgi:putative FmdB family regulatory protein
MPIYEYRCLDCGRYQSVLVRTYSDPTDLTCPRCQGTHLRKLISRFAVLHSDESRLEDLADPSSLGDVDENDPRSVARWARKMGDQMGEDLGDDFHEMVDRLEAGESPEGLDGEGGEGTGDVGGDDLF